MGGAYFLAFRFTQLSRGLALLVGGAGLPSLLTTAPAAGAPEADELAPGDELLIPDEDDELDPEELAEPDPLGTLAAGVVEEAVEGAGGGGALGLPFPFANFCRFGNAMSGE
jgi:hypothetical protein